jgi:DNA-binding response OmpR family regulator
MPSPVIIFSTDKLRGGIIQKVLERTGLESLVVNRFLAAREAIADNAPRVAILDTQGVFSDELNLLKNFCRALWDTLWDTAVIVLGDRSIVDTFRGEGVQEGFCLPDPLDPELIASKVKEILSSKGKVDRLQSDGLESDLKRFLKLD